MTRHAKSAKKKELVQVTKTRESSFASKLWVWEAETESARTLCASLREAGKGEQPEKSGEKARKRERERENRKEYEAVMEEPVRLAHGRYRCKSAYETYKRFARTNTRQRKGKGILVSEMGRVRRRTGGKKEGNDGR